MTLAIIDTGCANIFSVEAALDRLGVRHLVAKRPVDAVGCDRLILPGVGAAGPAMMRLATSGWAATLKSESRPVLGICLGMQLLFERSAEGNVEGLGLIPGNVDAMTAPLDGVLPHMGWNRLELPKTANELLQGIAQGEQVYFVHSYAAPVGSNTIARTDYGAPFSAAVRKANVMGCQFHPERSGKAGARILRNFMEVS